MEKIVFVNGQAPALNASNLNQLQENIEDAIDDVITDGTELPQTAEDGSIFLLHD